MTVVISANGLSGDKNYALQVRPVFSDGSTGDWGPTFTIIRRTLTPATSIQPLAAWPGGISVSWSGLLDPAFAEFEEQWLVKKFDTPPTAETFSSSGVEIYRGKTLTTVNTDLRQERVAYLGVAKIDKYGNISSILYSGKTFDVPALLSNSTVNNLSGGFSVTFEAPEPTETHAFVVLKIKNGDPFTRYAIINKAKSGSVCTLTTSGTTPPVGKLVNVSIGDSQFDGIFIVTDSVAGTFSYTHTSSATVNSTAINGSAFPVEAGPVVEGEEIYRYQITEAGSNTFEYVPETSGKPIYIAIGLEDIYQNMSSWNLLDVSGKVLKYGRNYIAARTAPILLTNPNTSSDNIWKYGYAGWGNVHNATTKALAAAGVNPGLKIEVVTADTPDSIRLGFKNGTVTPMSFGTQSRVYPSRVNFDSTIPTDELSTDYTSLPIVDDPHLPDGLSTENMTFAEQWAASYPAGTLGRGQVWAECSASNVVDDSIDTRQPIFLNGSNILSGTFKVTPSSWGGANDNLTAYLRLYAIVGDWSTTRPGAVYDPHYQPLSDKGFQRAVKKANTATTVSKSTRTVTLTLVAGKTVYPAVGDLITVSTGVGSEIDGTAIVATSSSNVITYRTRTSATVASVATSGSVSTNLGDTWTVLRKEKYDDVNYTNNVCKLWVTAADPLLPAEGEYIHVDINDLAFDSNSTGENQSFQIIATGTDANGYWFTYVNDVSTTGTVAASAVTGTDKRVFVKRSQEVSIDLVGDWAIGKEEGLNLYNGSTFLTKTLNWEWTAKTNATPETLRLVWVLDFYEQDLLTSRNSAGTSVTSLVADGSEYSIKLSEFTAWPGKNAYAATGYANEFSDKQTFQDGFVSNGSATFMQDVAVEGNLDVQGDITTEGKITSDSLEITNDLNILDGQGYIGGAEILNANNIYAYTDDYPNTNAGSLAEPGPNTINSIRVSNAPPVSAANYLIVVTWSGRFDGTDASGNWLFRMWRGLPNETGDAKWTQVRQITSGGPDPGGSITHIHTQTASAVNQKPAYAVTIEKLSGTGGVTNITTNDSQDANKMALLLIPIDNRDSPTYKPTTLLGTTTVPGYTSSGGDGTENNPTTTTTKTAVIKFTGGWKNSYKGSGETNSYTGGDLMQGYYSGTNGNQKSAWGFGNDDWVKESGAENMGQVVAGSVKILACYLEVKATHWWSSSGGTAIVGTHNSSSTSSVSNWNNIAGKSPNRKSLAFPGTVTRRIDLGTRIGEELWQGHARSNWNGGTAADRAIAGAASAQGIVFGPGPSTASKYYGSFARSSLKVVMKVQWKEP